MIYVFAHGSLINPESRAQTLSVNSTCICENALLNDYARKLNAPFSDGYLYMNIVPKDGYCVAGVVLAIADEDLPALRDREAGYELIDVSPDVTPRIAQPVYAFAQPDRSFPGWYVLQSYLDTCLARIPEGMRQAWLDTTIIENDVFDDRDDPRYEFASRNAIINDN